MSTLLHIISSITGDNSHSAQITQEAVDLWLAKNPDGKVVVRNIAADNFPHLDSARVGAFFTPVENRSAEQQAIVDFSDSLIDELRHADHIVLGVPLYNFGMPSTLKAYFDHIARAGVTFTYTENGPKGLLPSVPTTVVSTRGGFYKDIPAVGWQVSTFLGFIGLTNVTEIEVEGLSLGEESVSAARKAATEQLADVFA